MTDREKVISDVISAFDEWENNTCCPGDDWSDVHQSRDMVIAMLKAQEPRVMTLEEVKALPDESDVWLEEFCSTVVAATVSHQMDIYKVLKRYKENATYFYGIERADYNSGEYMDADYGKEWRCWTSRPDDKRSTETPWE